MSVFPLIWLKLESNTVKKMGADIIDADVIIVGGGMVGLSMAASLVASDLSVLVIEKDAIKQDQLKKQLADSKIEPENYFTRVSAISPGNQRFLQELGCWQNIPPSRLSDYEAMFVWDGEGLGNIEFRADEIGERHLGSIVENEIIRAAILAYLEKQPNIHFLCESSIHAINLKSSSVEIAFDNNKSIKARLLIGADGALSRIRKLTGIALSQNAYNQIAMVANVKTEKPHQSTAWQKFNTSGPVAFLPMPDPNVCSIVWSLDENEVEKLDLNDNEKFAEALNAHFDHKLGKLTLISQVGRFPLIKRHAQTYLAERCVLIGDAAHTIHPLAGQGVNLGFQDVQSLARLLTGLQSKGRDIGLKTNLRSYERERASENHIMQEAMSGFKWMFGQRDKSIISIRNLVMGMLDRTTTAKEMLIRRAMGL